MSTIDEKIKRLEEIQKSIYTLAEKADTVIVSYGSMNDVRSALIQIQQQSMNIFEIVSDLENEQEADEILEEIQFDLDAPEFEQSDMPSLPLSHEDVQREFFDEKDINGKPFFPPPCSKDDDRVIIFFDGCKKINHDNNAKHFPNVPLDKFKLTQGPRYIKVVRGGGVHCFIDRTNGDVLKAASWSAPARHKRGNIWDDDNGLNCMGEYGAAYLRG